jgi:predicted hotdog family 3-hydroxylacyl-ACP dehydratase
MIANEELLSLLPHRGRMLLLSGIKEYNLDEQTLCAEYHISGDCIFYDPVLDAVPAWVGFEFMAQAISVLRGIWCRENGRPVPFGLILSVSSMQMKIPFFKTGNTLEIRVKESSHIDQVFNFDGEILVEGINVMEGKLTLLDEEELKVKSLLKGNNSIE